MKKEDFKARKATDGHCDFCGEKFSRIFYTDGEESLCSAKCVEAACIHESILAKEMWEFDPYYTP